MDLELAVELGAEGPRLALYGRGGVGHRFACCGSDELDPCRVPGPERGAFGRRRADSAGRRIAQDAQGSRKAAGWRSDGAVAAPPAAQTMAGGHRLALGALLRGTEPEPERDLLRETTARNEEVSR